MYSSLHKLYKYCCKNPSYKNVDVENLCNDCDRLSRKDTHQTILKYSSFNSWIRLNMLIVLTLSNP